MGLICCPQFRRRPDAAVAVRGRSVRAYWARGEAIMLRVDQIIAPEGEGGCQTPSHMS
jgi:hypothetical protein